MEYQELLEKIEKVLKTTKFGVLATANKEGVVSTAQMCIINDGLTLYFQTDNSFEKVQNIKENPNVGINLGTFYFKGSATIVGHPTTNAKFIELIKEKHPMTYSNYTNLINEILIEVKLTECKIWGVDNSKDIHNQETIQVIDLENKTKRLIHCDKM